MPERKFKIKTVWLSSYKSKDLNSAYYKELVDIIRMYVCMYV